MKKIFDIFKIKKEERWLALGIFLALAVLNGVVIALCQSFHPHHG